LAGIPGQEFMAQRGIVSISGADIFPASALIDFALEIFKDTKSWTEEGAQKTFSEHIWELSIKLRSSDNDTLSDSFNPSQLGNGVIHAMIEMMDISIKKRLAHFPGIGLTNEFSIPVWCLSALHELCFYQLGCQEMSKPLNLNLLMKIINLPLVDINKQHRRYVNMTQFQCNQFCGQLEQVILDLFGRLLFGLRRDCDANRRSLVISLLQSNEGTACLSQCESTASLLSELQLKQPKGQIQFVLDSFTNFSSAVKQIRDYLSSGDTTKVWQSIYCMERLIHPQTSKETALKSQTRSTMATAATGAGKAITRTCDHCGKHGCDLACSRCKAVTYCDAKCQKAEWKRHKKSCNA